ncbi:hypothetical protein COCON_G00068060 [Conger conger]|uniref:Uncharacterized protein n=1 Tax=Conger conger TaxID=82655 RepID=A0A9Q1I457_CONCO|nr:hypothetical protein COCON_G00068060 [Conger conger]
MSTFSRRDVLVTAGPPSQPPPSAKKSKAAVTTNHVLLNSVQTNGTAFAQTLPVWGQQQPTSSSCPVILRCCWDRIKLQ